MSASRSRDFRFPLAPELARRNAVVADARRELRRVREAHANARGAADETRTVLRRAKQRLARRLDNSDVHPGGWGREQLVCQRQSEGVRRWIAELEQRSRELAERCRVLAEQERNVARRLSGEIAAVRVLEDERGRRLRIWQKERERARDEEQESDFLVRWRPS